MLEQNALSWQALSCYSVVAIL